MKRSMRRSMAVPMVFLGTLGALSGCGDGGNAAVQSLTNTDVEMKQEFYTTIEDCQKDWGTAGENCQQSSANPVVATSGDALAASGSSSAAGSGSSGGAHYMGYVGPRYYWYRTESGGYPVTLTPSGTVKALTSNAIAETGSSVAKSQVSSRVSVPSHMASSGSVSRGGFGSIGGSHGSSSGG